MAVNAGADQSNLEPYEPVTVTATGGTGSHTWVVVSGLAVNIPAGTGASRTFPAPVHKDGGSTLLRVTDATSVDEVTLTTLRHNEWRFVFGGYGSGAYGAGPYGASPNYGMGRYSSALYGQ